LQLAKYLVANCMLCYATDFLPFLLAGEGLCCLHTGNETLTLLSSPDNCNYTYDHVVSWRLHSEPAPTLRPVLSPFGARWLAGFMSSKAGPVCMQRQG
jgi:hypothetical protein